MSRAIYHLPDRLAARAAVICIKAYRRWISPRKGFRCAHAAMTNGESCSDVGLRVFSSRRPVLECVREVTQQRARCRESFNQYRGLKGDAAQLLAIAPILADGDTIIKCC